MILTREQAAAMARSALDGDRLDADASRRLALLCRGAGALAEARDLLDRFIALDGEDAHARRLHAVLHRRFEAPPSPGLAFAPAPFAHLADFLPAERHAEVLALTLAARADFKPSHADTGDDTALRPELRSSESLPETGAIAKLFLPQLKALFDTGLLASLAGQAQFTPDGVELQVTAHGDGAFFKAHVDSAPGHHEHRRLTFVYYFLKPPKRFSGGALRVFDTPANGGDHDLGLFTAIPPDPNSLVLFPSHCLHEVEAVRTQSPAPDAARFSINGWL